MDEKIFRDRLTEGLHTLLPAQAEVLVLRYGLSGSSPYSLEEIAAAVRKTVEEVEELEESALLELGLVK